MLTSPLLLAVILPTIWIVDASNGPGTNFTDLPDAVAAAATGDVIVVRPGTYSAFAVRGKALTIHGAGAATTIVANPAPPSASPYQETSIDNVPAGSAFYIAGMAFAPPVPSPVNLSTNPAILVQGVDTFVTLADVHATGISMSQGSPGLHVAAGAVVHAARCTFTGGAGSSGSGGDGALVFAGGLVADASTFTGGTGGPQLFARGGSGVHVQGTGFSSTGFASIARSSASGASGAFAGGHGFVADPQGFGRVAGTSANTLAGALGPWSAGVPAVATTFATIVIHGNVSLVPSSPGGPVTGGSGSITIGAPSLPRLSDSGTTNSGGEMVATQPVVVTFDGVIPFAPFVCAVDTVPDLASAPLVLGELLIPPPTFVALEGTLDAAGMAQVTLIPSMDAPSLTNVPIYAQFGVLDSIAGQVRLSNALIRVYRN